MDSCETCGKDTPSRKNFIQKVMVCTVCGAVKGPLPTETLSLNIEEIVRPPCQAIVNVSTDEWVMMTKSSNAWLCTQGLIRCVGLVVESSDRVALAHVLDRDHKSTDDVAAIHQLNLIATVLGRSNITAVNVILTSRDSDTPTFKLVRAWIKQCGVDEQNVDVWRGYNCVLVCPEKDTPTQEGREVTKEEMRLVKNPKTGLNWITNWGKLPQWNGHTE